MIIHQTVNHFIQRPAQSVGQRLRTKLFVDEVSHHSNLTDLVYINPEDIKYTTRTKFGSGLNGPIIAQGRWDKIVTPFTERYKVKSIINHFKYNTNWENTEYFKRLNFRRKIRSKHHRGSTKNEILDYLNNYDKLYEDIKKEGYKITSSPHTRINTDSEDLPSQCEEPSEIGVAIGRDGELFWQNGGQHRLAIAKSLNLELVPVQVHAIHADWEKRKEYVQSSKSIFNHTNTGS